MRTKLGVFPGGALSGVILFALAVAARPDGDPGARAAAQVPRSNCPYALPLDQVRMEIVEIFFTDVVHGIDGNKLEIPDDKKDQFDIGVVTIKITKPAGSTLEIAAADLTLHYYHGDRTDAAPCEGLSGFSMTLDVERPMKLPRVPGPSFTKQATGARSTRASVVYIDVPFAWLEPDIRECWLCVGQPSTSEPFVVIGGSGGW